MLLCSLLDMYVRTYERTWCARMIFLPQRWKNQAFNVSFASFFDNHFIISWNNGTITWVFCIANAICQADEEREKISLCTQFINYNFRIIYQIVEYGNRIHTFHSYSSSIFTHFALIGIKTKMGKNSELGGTRMSHTKRLCLTYAY